MRLSVGSSCTKLRVKFCVFSECHSSGRGGGIYASSSSLESQIERSFFHLCSSVSDEGGSFYISLKKSLMSHCCMSKCSATLTHAFSAYLLNNEEVNECNATTILSCPTKGENIRTMFILGNGIQSLCLDNVSNSNTNSHRGVHLDAEVESHSHSLTVVQNKIGSTFYSCDNYHAMERVNAINNSYTPSYKALIYVTKSGSFADSVFASNSHTTFKGKGTVDFTRCAFCSNGFPDPPNDLCVPTHALRHLSSYVCGSAASAPHTVQVSPLSIAPLCIHFVAFW